MQIFTKSDLSRAAVVALLATTFGILAVPQASANSFHVLENPDVSGGMLPARGVEATALVNAPSRAADSETFPRYQALKPQIDFWKRVFAEQSESQTIIHDKLYMDKTLAVLNFAKQPEKGHARDQHRKRMRERVRAKQADIKRRLQRLDNITSASQVSGLDKRLWLLYRDVPGPNRYKKAAERLRSQRGLKERFRAAIIRGGRYWPHIEKKFAAAGLPFELTRLPLVESAFQERAYSYARAAGVWQFIPSSARIHMRLDAITDDRYDPLFATDGAISHLKADYAELNDWPLAVNAYNFGRGGISRAVREINAKSIVDLVQRYRRGRYKFASRNYYAEFVAAVDVERNQHKYFGKLKPDPVWKFDEYITQDYVQYKTLERISKVSAKKFAELNPSFTRWVRNGDLHVPPGYLIRLPHGGGKRFRAAYAQLNKNQLFAAQKPMPARARSYAAASKPRIIRHKVKRGQNLASIAKRYGSSISAIRRHNRLRSNNHIMVGQTLKVPVKGRRVAARYKTHRVKRGESLLGIALRNGTSLTELQRFNGLRSASKIRAGQRIKIPLRSNSVAAIAKRANKPKVRYQRHTVKRGETADGIARRYGVSRSSLARANGLRNINNIRIGQRLKIPGGKRIAAAPKKKTQRHKIRSGQTLASIARRYGTSVSTLQRLNGIRRANNIRAGQVIRVR